MDGSTCATEPHPVEQLVLTMASVTAPVLNLPLQQAELSLRMLGAVDMFDPNLKQKQEADINLSLLCFYLMAAARDLCFHSNALG